MTAKNPICKHLLQGLALAFLFGMWACAQTPRAMNAGDQSPVRYQAEQNKLEEGVGAFVQNDYERAGVIFQMLTETAQDPQVLRKALYALASVRLVLARNPLEYAEAVSLWESWSGQAGTALAGEDPRMISPFLRRLSPSAVMAAQGDSIQEPPARTPKENSSGANYKGILQSREKEVENLRARLDSREREIRRLRHQLESLEEIHRKYQEKKQEASAP